MSRNLVPSNNHRNFLDRFRELNEQFGGGSKRVGQAIDQGILDAVILEIMAAKGILAKIRINGVQLHALTEDHSFIQRVQELRHSGLLDEEGQALFDTVAAEAIKRSIYYTGSLTDVVAEAIAEVASRRIIVEPQNRGRWPWQS